MTQMKTERKKNRDKRILKPYITNLCYKCKWVKYSKLKGRYFQATGKWKIGN